MSAQRFRVWFRKGERVRYISHLDVLRFWERAIRRAGLPLAYSQGFTPHPRLAFASPLPLGFTSEAEVMDVTLDERVDQAEFVSRVAAQASVDLAVVRVQEIPLTLPAPQAAMLWADYELEVYGVEEDSARDAVRQFMARGSFEWTEERREKARTYDLRATVATLSLAPVAGGMSLAMRLRADGEMTGRPEQVVAAVLPGAAPDRIRRTLIVLDEQSPAREAWRRAGQFA